MKNAFTRKQSNDFIGLEVKTAVHHFALCMPLRQQAKKGVTVLAGAIDPDYGEVGASFHTGGREEYA